MDDDARAASIDGRRHRHLDPITLFGTNVPQGGCTLMTEHSARAAAEDSGHPFAVPPEFRPAHCVSPSPHRMQASLRNAVLDRIRAEAELQQLAPSHDTVLVLRE